MIISQMSTQLNNRQNNIASTAAAAECLFGKIQDAIKSGRAQGTSSKIAKPDRSGLRESLRLPDAYPQIRKRSEVKSAVTDFDRWIALIIELL